MKRQPCLALPNDTIWRDKSWQDHSPNSARFEQNWHPSRFTISRFQHLIEKTSNSLEGMPMAASLVAELSRMMGQMSGWQKEDYTILIKHHSQTSTPSRDEKLPIGEQDCWSLIQGRRSLMKLNARDLWWIPNASCPRVSTLHSPD